MFFADFETTTSKISTTSSSIWLWGIKGGLKGDKLHYGIDMKSFFDTMKKEEMSIVYFHNVSFDFNFIFKWLLNNNFKFKKMVQGEKLELDKNTWSWIADERGAIYSALVNYEDIEIRFLDSWKILMSSVGDLGEAIGFPKLDLDYDAFDIYEKKEEVPKKALTYLERDIDVVIKTISTAFSLYDKKITRASMAYEDFKKYYNDQNTSKSKRQFSVDFGGKVWNYKTKSFEWYNVLTKQEWLRLSNSYQGGYTNWNTKYTNKEINNIEGVSYDVNSLYPSVMMNKKIPYGKTYYTKPKDECIKLETILIHKAIIKDNNFPPLIKKKGGGKYSAAKYLKIVEHNEYTYWEEELNFIKKYYDIKYTVLETVWYKTKFVFSNWLNEKKELKINAKNETERNFHKGIYNSTYGKFAQNIYMGQRIIIEDGMYVIKKDHYRYLVPKEERDKVSFIKGKDMIIYYGIQGNEWILKSTPSKEEKAFAKDPHNKLYEYQNVPIAVNKYASSIKYNRIPTNRQRYGKNGEYKHDYEFIETKEYKHVAVASYITSQARLILWQAMFDNLKWWIYSDTDSCYFLKEVFNLDVHESKFGAWKKEHKYDKIKVLRAKGYMYHSTHEWKQGKWKKEDKLVKKISGISKQGKQYVNWDNFYLGSTIKNAKTAVINVEGGKLITSTDFKLGEAI